MLKAVAETLKKHPLFNSSLDEAANEIVLKDYYHVGIAVDTEQGLIVPVIRDVDKKSVLDLAKELSKSRRRRATGRFSPRNSRVGLSRFRTRPRLAGRTLYILPAPPTWSIPTSSYYTKATLAT